jgi:hypothetical protein
MMRKGLTKGSGRIGYYNVIAKDPMVHRQSARGIKQPQSGGKYTAVAPTLNRLTENEKNTIRTKVVNSGLRGMKALEYAEKLAIDTLRSKHKGGKIDWEMLGTQAKEFGKEIGSEIGDKARELYEYEKENFPKQVEAVKKFAADKYDDYKKKKEKEESEKLKSVSVAKPLITKLKRQHERVEQLNKEIEDEEDEEDVTELKAERDREQEELRELQNKLTDLPFEDLSNAELKHLSIVYKDDGFFASGNKYEDELIRRVRQEKKVNKEIADAQKGNSEGTWLWE